MTEPVAIGIDLGTTYSCVAAMMPNGRVEVIDNDSGHRTTPSIVAFSYNEQFIGESARMQALENPTNTVFAVKRLIGRKFDELQEDIRKWPFSVVSDENKPKVSVDYNNKKTSFTPEEISAMILRKMKETAEARLETTVTEAVITVPAYFNDAQRKATIDAGRIAGLKVLRLINEPTAAALCFGYEKNIKDARNILVFDLGGGTFDVSIVTIQNGQFTVRAVDGNTHLGGEDVTNALVDALVAEYKRKHNKDIVANKKAMSRLREKCESAKRDLSLRELTKIFLDALIDGEDYSMQLTRSRLEEINKQLFDKTLQTVESAIKNAKIDKNDIHDVLLVGGSTRIPQVRALLQGFFDGKKLSQGVNPDEAVAIGAAIFANMIQQNTGNITEKITLSDVTPLSLGIETEGGLAAKLIKRNTPIPATIMQTFPTSSDNQIDVKISVFEGERPMFADNHILGTFVLKGLPPAPKGAVKLNVTFDIDVNGSLTVSAIDAISGVCAKNQITITNDQGRLSEQDISRMIEDSKKYKAEDEKQKARVLSKTKLDDYVLLIESQIAENFHNRIAEVDKKKVLNFCNEISEWLKELPREVDEYKNKQKELEQIWFPIVTKLLK